MYRHTTPYPLDSILENSPEAASRVPLIEYEREVDIVWGDYPGYRAGPGKYCDIFSGDVPVGRVWATGTAVGLLHVPCDRKDSFEYVLQNWNASAIIRKGFHDKVPASDTFDAVVAAFDNGGVVETDNLYNINFPEIDALFYVNRYDPNDDFIWCEEMK